MANALANPLMAYFQGQQDRRQNMLQDQQMQRQNRLLDMQEQTFREAQEDRASKNALKPIIGQALGGDRSVIPQIAGQDPELAMKIQAHYGSMDAAALKASADKLESAKKQLELTGQLLGAAKDEPSYQAGLQQARTMGIDVSQAPPNFDPAWIQQTKMQTLTAYQQVQQEADAAKFEYQKKNDAANRGVTIRGQNLADARARDAQQMGRTPVGYRQNPDGSLSFIPGGPGDPSTKLGGPATEDERKAAGWYNSAQEAFAGINALLEKNPDAGTPNPVSAILQEVPSFGVGESVAGALRGEDKRSFDQYMLTISDAVLRAASGANAPEQEVRRKMKELTPSYLDSNEIKRQKLKATQTYIESLLTRAGRAAVPKKPPVQPGTPPAAPGVSAPGGRPPLSSFNR